MRRAVEGFACFCMALAMLLGAAVYRMRLKSHAPLLESRQQNSWTLPSKERARTRLALRKLETNLEGELTSVRAILNKIESIHPPHASKVMSLQAKATDMKDKTDEKTQGHNAEQDIQVPDAAWRKRTMQQGALRGESVEKQLQRVLEKDLLDKIKKKTSWKSKEEIEKAIKFADYLKAHPLDSTSGVKQSTLGTANGAEPSAEEEGSGSSPVIKVHFKREVHSISDADYKELEEDLIRLYNDLNKDKRGYKDEEQEHQKEQETSTEVHEERRVSAMKKLPERGAEGTQYVVQPGDRAIALSDVYGRKWAEDEILREHGNFVQLPKEDELPLAVKPYWYSSLNK